MLDPFANQSIDVARLEARRDPDRPDVGVEERKRERRRLAPDRATLDLEPGEQELLDLPERLDAGAGQPQRPRTIG